QQDALQVGHRTPVAGLLADINEALDLLPVLPCPAVVPLAPQVDLRLLLPLGVTKDVLLHALPQVGVGALALLVRAVRCGVDAPHLRRVGGRVLEGLPPDLRNGLALPQRHEEDVDATQALDVVVRLCVTGLAWAAAE